MGSYFKLNLRLIYMTSFRERVSDEFSDWTTGESEWKGDDNKNIRKGREWDGRKAKKKK